MVYGILFSGRTTMKRHSDLIKLLNTVVLLQYVPRVRVIYLSWKELTRRDGKFVGWVTVVFNLFLYILASHVSFYTNFIFIMGEL